MIAGIFASMLTGTDYSRLKKQWNREYVLGTFGLYTYQISDSVSCINAKLNMLMGYSESEEAFREFYDKKEETKPKKKDNDYSNIFEGKNIITIHAESIQQFILYDISLCTCCYSHQAAITSNKLFRYVSF